MQDVRYLLAHCTLGPGEAVTLTAQRITEIRARIAELDAAKRSNWSEQARPNQVAPASYKQWIVQAGRGFGKTRCAAEEVARIADENPGCTIAVIAQKDQKLDTVCFNGQDGSSLCEVIPKSKQLRYYSTSGNVHLVLTNGSVIRGFSSEKPDGIAGYNLAAWWADEFALYSPSNASAVMVQLKMATRKKGVIPRGIITTTPRRVQHMRDLVAKAEEDPDNYVLVRGSTKDNEENLAPEFIEEIHKEYAGTRLGLQELDGVLLDDNENALFSGDLIAAALAKSMPAAFDRVVCAIDPSGSATGDAMGIVIVGVSGEDIGVLGDYTTNGTPEFRYLAACRAAHVHGASQFVVETNYGGDATAAGLRAAWTRYDAPDKGRLPTIVPVTAKGDKAARAEPVVGKYEQGRVSHAPGPLGKGLELLQGEMLDWEPGSPTSPNRLDACVWGIRHLTDKPRNAKPAQVPTGPRDAVRRKSQLTQRQIVR